jgi:hypothetical protein
MEIMIEGYRSNAQGNLLVPLNVKFVIEGHVAFLQVGPGLRANMTNHS